MKKFVRWFASSLLLALILTGGVASHCAGDKIISQSQPNAKVEGTTKSDTPENSSSSPETPLRKWGYMDRKGRLVIPPRFDSAGPFSSGVARVRISEGEETKMGFINRKGELVFFICGKECLDRDYENWDFSEGLLPLREEPNGKLGYVDTTGKFVIKPQFDSADSFSEGRAVVSWRNTDEWHNAVIDRTGKIIFDAGTSRTVRHFQQGIAVVREPFESNRYRYRYGLIDRQGNFLIEPFLLSIKSWDNTGYSGSNPRIEFSWDRMPVRVVQQEVQIPYSIPSEWRGKWGYIDRKGNWVIEPKFDGAGQFTEGRAVIINETENDPDWWQWGILIDEKGNIIDTSQQDPKPKLTKVVSEFHEGLMPADSENGKSGYIDRSGKWAIEPRFSGTLNFSNGLARVIVGYKYGYINRSGEVVIPTQFDYARDFQDNGLAIVKVGEKYGIINRQGEYILEPKYSINSHLKARRGTIFIDGVAKIHLDDAKETPSYYLNSDLEILPCPQWGIGTSSEGLIPILTDVAPQKECPIARDNE